MRKVGPERRAELLRKLVHVGSGFIALALRWLDWKQALVLALGAFAFNLLLLPRLGGSSLHRPHERERGWAFGILAYPLAVAALVVFFRHSLEIAAAGWALLAFGDGMAAVVGSLRGRHALPWNPRKSWEGTFALVAFGTLASFAIATFVAGGTRLVPYPAWELAVALLLGAVAAAAVESIDSGVDDNLLVPLVGTGVAAVALAALGGGLVGRLLAGEGGVQGRLAWSAAACGVLAMLALWRGSLDVPGAVAAALLGTGVATFGGWLPFLVLCAFFALSVAATRLGRRVKESRGIAEPRGGRRSVGNVLANGGVALLLSIACFAVAGRPPALALELAACAAMATATFDTVSSEMGKAYGRTTYLSTTLSRVPPGTEGAVSLEGTLAGLAAALVAFVLPLTLLVPAAWTGPDALGLAVVAAAVAASAFVGGTFESVVGAACHQRGHAVDNDFMNFGNTVVGAAVMGTMAPHLVGALDLAS